MTSHRNTKERHDSEETTACLRGTEPHLRKVWQLQLICFDARFAERQCNEFKVVIRQGKNTFQRFGVASDSIRGAATQKKQVRSFCSIFTMQLSVTYSTQKHLYSRGEIQILATSWCMRMQHFFDAWVFHSCSPGFEFGNGDIAACPEPPELQQLLDRPTCSTLFADRAAQVRATVPSKPKVDTS